MPTANQPLGRYQRAVLEQLAATGAPVRVADLVGAGDSPVRVVRQLAERGLIRLTEQDSAPGGPRGRLLVSLASAAPSTNGARRLPAAAKGLPPDVAAAFGAAPLVAAHRWRRHGPRWWWRVELQPQADLAATLALLQQDGFPQVEPVCDPACPGHIWLREGLPGE